MITKQITTKTLVKASVPCFVEIVENREKGNKTMANVRKGDRLEYRKGPAREYGTVIEANAIRFIVQWADCVQTIWQSELTARSHEINIVFDARRDNTMGDGMD